MVRSIEFKNLITALRKEGFKFYWFKTSTQSGYGYYTACLANHRVQARIYDGHIWEKGNIQIFYSLNKEYNKMGDAYHAQMPKTPEELKELVYKIKNAETQWPNLETKSK